MQFVHRLVDTRSRKICSVPQCSSYCTKDISLHIFPRDPKLRKTWQTILKIGKPIGKHMLVCSQHFTDSDFTLATNKRRRIKKQAIPSQKIPQSSCLIKKSVIDRSKRHWLQKYTLNIGSEGPMEIEKLQEECATNILHVEENLESPLNKTIEVSASTSHETLFSNIMYKDKAIQTEFSEFFELLQLLNTDEKLINFTGVNFDILATITACAQRISDYNKCNWPNMKERIILVLCKLKLNISFACLSTLFKISKSQCSTIFYSTVSLLAIALKPAIYWPTKEQILRNTPKCFEMFRSTRVVLDCTEIKIQKLQCLRCRVRSYSHYKGTHTLKYLIGITPSGLISFVSVGFGGRATDKSIFNYSNILDMVDPNDAVMVDKGFLIERECNERLVKLIRPPFLKKQQQLSKEDSETTADIARARVHVERAIQRIKIFKIFQDQLHWFLIPYADDIMFIITAIVNLSAPILKDDKILNT